MSKYLFGELHLYALCAYLRDDGELHQSMIHFTNKSFHAAANTLEKQLSK